MYGSFASIYDELMDEVDYKKWFEYIKEIFSKNGNKPKNILEMACGTGNLSKFFAEENYDLTCFDLSLDMLTVADNKLSKYKNVKILNQDMTSFDFGIKYDSIVSICDSINYIIDKTELEKVFKNVYNHLEDDGIFIFDINSSYKLKEIISNNIFVEDREKIFYTWESYYDEIEKINQFYINFFVQNKNGFYDRFIEEHYERAYEVEELNDMLKNIGFTSIEVFKAFTFDEVEIDTERINFVVKK